jgi:hypothetical protein
MSYKSCLIAAKNTKIFQAVLLTNDDQSQNNHQRSSTTNLILDDSEYNNMETRDISINTIYTLDQSYIVSEGLLMLFLPPIFLIH